MGAPTSAGTRAASSCLGLRESQTKQGSANLLIMTLCAGGQSPTEEARPWTLKPIPIQTTISGPETPQGRGRVLDPPLRKIFPPAKKVLV